MRDVWTRRFAFLLAGGLLGLKIPGVLRIEFILFLILIMVRVWFWRAKDFFGQLYKPEILVLIASFTLGALYGYTGNLALEKPLTIKNIQVTGVLKDWNQSVGLATGVLQVVDPPDLKGKNYKLQVYFDREGNLAGNWARAVPGDELRFAARLEQPKSPGTPGQYNLPLYYAVRGQAGSLTAQGDAEIVRMGEPSPVWKVRDHIRQIFEQWPPEKTAVLEGILFGDSSGIPQNEIERYKITGVLHVFSASGSNVAFVLVIFWFLFRFLPRPLRILTTGLSLIFYALLCGGNPPIVRATIMGVLALLGKMTKGQTDALRNLFLAGAGLFFRQPLMLEDIGFQLSFMATWGIITLAPKLSEQKVFAWIPRPLRPAVTMTLAAQMATLPLLIGAFHRVSVIGLLANLVLLLVLGGAFELGLIGVLLSFSTLWAAPFFQVSLWLLGAANVMLRFFAQMPGADVWVLNPGIPFWIVWYGWLALFLMGKERCFFMFQVGLRKLRDHRLARLLRPHFLIPAERTTGMNLRLWISQLSFAAEKGFLWRGVLIFVVLLFILAPWKSRDEVRVSFIDVGQGDSILIETPDQHAVLIDTGPKNERFDAGERIVLPYLLEKRIKHLDALILTHTHEDHVGGALAILNNIPVEWVGIPDDGQAWNRIGGTSLENTLDDRLVQRLAQFQLKLLKAGDRVAVEPEVSLDVLAPGEVLTGTHSDANNNSLVLKLAYRGKSVLLTGDMETEEMQQLLDSGQDIAVDYFKEPHHGSRFSLNMEFLNSINPEAVFVSVGKNTFGHPDPQVIQYWEERHTPFYRTDERGTIELRLDESGQSSLTMGR